MRTALSHPDKSKMLTVLADLSLILMVVIWGSTFFMIKDHINNVDPVGMLVYRFFIAAAVTFLIVIAQKKNPFKNFHQGLHVGIYLWLMYASQNLGMVETSASNSGFITALFVAFVPVFSITIYKRWPGTMRLFAALLSLVGLWFLTGGFSGLNRGDLITLIAPVAVAIYVLVSDDFLKNGTDPMVLSFQQFFVTGVLSLVYMLVLGKSFEVKTEATWGVILYLSLVATVITFIVYNYVQRISTPMKVTLIFALEPVFAAFFAYVFGGERFSSTQMVGGGLIVLAMILSELKIRKLFNINLGEDDDQDNLDSEPNDQLKDCQI